MSVRQVNPHGRKVWQARVAYRGRRKSTIRPTKHEAKIAEAELLKDLQAEAAQAEADEQRPATLRELFKAYAEDLEARGKSEESVRNVKYTGVMLERVLPELMDRPVGELTVRDLFTFRQARLRDQKKSETINSDLYRIRAMVRRVRPDFHCPSDLFLPETERVRSLEAKDMFVFKLVRPPSREMAKLAALTLMRQGEIRRLRREYVHLNRGVVELPQAKAGPRPVILNAEAREILRAQLEQHDSEWVFPNPRTGRPYHKSTVSRAWHQAAGAAGLRDFRFHDLRHHGATVTANRGYSILTLQALGGWKDVRSLKRYVHMFDKTLRAAAEDLTLEGVDREGGEGSGEGSA